MGIIKEKSNVFLTWETQLKGTVEETFVQIAPQMSVYLLNIYTPSGRGEEKVI